jgi:lipopolysaccharide/colanic/teichoic acid biosynthesis glycosyltransferase
MLPMKRGRIRFAILLLDLLWIVLSLGASYLLRYSSLPPQPANFYAALSLTVVATWCVLFQVMRLGGFDANWRMTAIGGRIGLATLLLMACVSSVEYLSRLYYSRLMLGYFTVFLFVGFMALRICVYQFLRHHHRGLASKVVLVGNNRVTRECAFKIYRHPELLYEVVGVLHPVAESSANGSGMVANGGTLSSIDALNVLRQKGVDELIILEHVPGLEFRTFVGRCRAQGIRVNVLPHGYELYTSKPAIAEIDGLPLISLEAPDPFPFGPAIKRGMDICIALALAVPATLITGLAALMLLGTKESAVRREIRIGKDGRAFSMYRLNVDRDSNEGPPFERWLRDLSISELPQLWNVLTGDMSLVGPRPEPHERVKHYSEWQRERLRAIPGMTGLAQVNGLREQHTSEEKTRFDLQYLLEWSPILDLSLLLQTVGTLARRCVQRRSPGNVIPFPARAASGLKLQGDRPAQVAHADRT